MKKKYTYIFAILLGIFCASMLVTFMFVDSKKTLADFKEKKPLITKPQTTAVKKINDDINDYLRDPENTSIRLSSSQNISINKKDTGVILAKLRTTNKVKLPDNDDSYMSLKELEYAYSIINDDLESNINIYSQGYIEVVDNDTRVIYSTVDIDLIIGKIDKCIIDKLVYCPLQEGHKQMILSALDDNNSNKLTKGELKNIGSELGILGIADTTGQLISAKYPNYNIKIMDDDNIVDISILDESKIRISSASYDIVFDTDKGLWKYLDLRYPVKNIIAENDIRYILKGDRVEVHDMYEDYDIATDSDFKMILARYIINADGVYMMDSDVINDEFLRYTISFYVHEVAKDVSIYDNYYIYNGEVYKSEGISERIKSLIIMP